MTASRNKRTSFCLLVLAGALTGAAHAQVGPGGYTITTIAGAGPAGSASSASVGLSQVYSVAVDGGGNVYVAVPAQNRVYKAAPNGTLTTVAGNGSAGFSGDNGPASGAQLNSPIGVAVDSSGNLYIADSGNSRVRKVSGGTITTVAGAGYGYSGDSGLAVNAALSNPTGIAVDGSGNLYIADSNNNRVRKVSNGVITTVAGNGTCCYSGDNGPAVNAQVNYPYSVAVDNTGDLFIGENNRIRKVAAGLITSVAGNGLAGFSGDNGLAVNAQIGPSDGVAADDFGNLYLADALSSRIRKVNAGIITTIAGGGGGCPQQVDSVDDGCPATSALLSNPYGVALDSQGNLFIADTNNYRVREILGGVISTIVGNGSYRNSGDNGAASTAQLSPQGIAVRSRGNYYIADTSDYRVRNVSGGVIGTVAGSGVCCYSGDNGAATAAQLNAAGIAVDALGNFYTAEPNRVRKVSNGIITTFAGTGASGFAGDNGPATAAVLGYSLAVAVDSSGNVYIADQYNNRVREVSGGIITTIAGGGPTDGVSATAISLGIAVGVAVDGAGNIYVPSPNNHRVYKVSTTGILTTVAGNGSAGFSGDNGSATLAQLNYPYGVAVNSAGTVLYIADRSNSRIRMVTAGVITTVAGGGSGCAQQTDSVGDGCTGTQSALSYPGVVALDSTGTILYIADALNYRVRKLAGGVITTVAGNGICCYNADNIAATSAELSYATAITVDNTGNLYIGDSENFRVRKVAGGMITTIAGTGSFGFSGDGGPATSAQLSYSYGVAVDGSGNVYIADAANHRIRKVSGGVITTVAGTGVSGYSGDSGPATSAQINDPYDVAVDSNGLLYIADTNNGRIRKVSGTTITTIAGNGLVSFSGDGSPATASQLNAPSGVAVDGAGRIYIADSGNHRVRQISTGGVITTVAGNGNFCCSGDSGPATSASMNASAIAVDSAGDIFLANQNTVRMVSGGIINTIAGNGISGYSGDGGPATYASLNNVQGLAVDNFGNVYVADVGNSNVRLLTTTPETITLLTPSSVIAGTGGFTLQVSGSGFSSGDTVLWNGQPLATTYGNSSQLTAGVSSSLIAQPGSAVVTINGVSNEVVFSILPDGVMTVASVAIPAGGTFSIPVTLAMNAARTPNDITFAVQIVPSGNTPALTGSLTFSSGLSATPVVNTAGTPNSIGVLWASLSSTVSGTLFLGNIVGTLPVSSTGGGLYLVQLTGAGASDGNVNYNISLGAAATISVRYIYPVGDVAPYASDTAPNFGDANLTILDLIQELFAVNNVPGFRPAPCTDRLDAMDLYPADTVTTRGGDGVLDIRDLVLELFRVNNLDMARPVRDSLGGCVVFSNQGLVSTVTPRSVEPARTRGPEADGSLLLGSPEPFGTSQERVPVYLEAKHDLTRVALTFALGDQHSPLAFVGSVAPTLANSQQPGVAVVAWLDGLSAPAGVRTLLGYLELPMGASSGLQVYGLSAVRLEDNQLLRLEMPDSMSRSR